MCRIGALSNKFHLEHVKKLSHFDGPLRISAIGKFNLVSPFISFAASAVRLPKRNEQGRLCGKEKGSLPNASTLNPTRSTLGRHTLAQGLFRVRFIKFKYALIMQKLLFVTC